MPERRPGGDRRPRVDRPRATAYDVLAAVRAEDAYANLALARLLRRDGLVGRDSAFVTELAAGAIRWRGTYEPIIRSCLTRPRLQPEVLDALLLGAHQLLAMRVPAHAAISSTVDLVRARVGRGPTGLVNAVLRRVAERDLPSWVAQVAPDPVLDPVGHLALAQSHPRWVVEALAEALHASRPHAEPGEDLAALLRADNEPPSVCLVARPGLATASELLSRAPGRPGRWSPHAVHLAGGDPGSLSEVAQGRAGVQDEGSQVVALLCAGAPLEGADRRWLDVCAGPGGKAALLAALAAERDAGLVAAEVQPHRAALVRRATTVEGGPAPGLVGIVAADGRRPPWPDGTFDRVLVDAPCTGLGALRRRPEARWRRNPDDLPGLTTLQSDLLDRAIAATRPGGVVVYATCSPVLAETLEVITQAVERHHRVDVLDLDGVLPGLPDAAGPVPGTLQLWPHVHGTDAMFVAALRCA